MNMEVIVPRLEAFLKKNGFTKGKDKDKNHYTRIITDDDSEINVISPRVAIGPTFKYLETEFYTLLDKLKETDGTFNKVDVYYVGSDAFDYM